MFSALLPVSVGVPHGSTLGPLPFSVNRSNFIIIKIICVMLYRWLSMPGYDGGFFLLKTNFSFPLLLKHLVIRGHLIVGHFSVFCLWYCMALSPQCHHNWRYINKTEFNWSALQGVWFYTPVQRDRKYHNSEMKRSGTILFSICYKYGELLLGNSKHCQLGWSMFILHQSAVHSLCPLPKWCTDEFNLPWLYCQHIASSPISKVVICNCIGFQIVYNEW